MKILQAITNKWQITYGITKDYKRRDRGWNIFLFGIVNLKSLPPEGARMTKEYYKGIIINFAFWFPIEKD